MIDIIKDKIKELEEQKSNYIEMLESGSIFEDSYVLKQLKICRGKIDILEDVLDEIKERYANITEEIMNNSENENEDYKGLINKETIKNVINK